MKTMSAKLRLATRLEDLETSQSQQATQRLLHQQSPEKFPAPESNLPRQHCHVAQILYAKDAYRGYPSWKRWAVINVYLPLFRVLHKWLGLFPPTRVEPDGTYSWLVHQGCFLTRAEAEADAKRYPHGYVVPNMPLGRSLTADVAEETSIYVPNKEDKGEPAKLSAAMVFEEVRKLKRDVRLAAARMI
jgi:hypothetical protein